MAAAAAAFPDGWSSLPSPLLAEIATRTLSASPLTGSLDDFNAFRSVCTSWRTAASKDVLTKNFSGPWRVPYLMLAEKDGTFEREFFNPATGKITGKLLLPEASGKRCIEARFGWLLTLANSGEVELLNPVSRSRIELPNFKSFKEYPIAIAPPYRFIRRAVLSANPSETEDFVLVMHTHTHLGFWKNGDENWTKIEQEYTSDDSAFEDVAYSAKYKKFFAIGSKGHVWCWDPNGDVAVAKWFFGTCGYWTGTYSGNVQGYLMEMPSGGNGDMLMVTRNGRIPNFHLDCCYPYGANKFKVFILKVGDEDKGIRQVAELQGAAIFVGHNAAVCVPISEFTGLIKPNRIYFSDDSIEAYFLPHVLPLKGKGCKSCIILHGYDLGKGDCEGETQEGDGDGESKSEEHHGDHKEGCEDEKQEDVGDGESKSEEVEGENQVDPEDENSESGDGDEPGEDSESGDGDEQGEDSEDDGDEQPEDDEGKYEWLWERTNFGALGGGGENAGIYNIEDGSIERFDESVLTLSLVCPPLWISPPSLFA